MEEYPSNSHKSKETEGQPEKRLEKVVSGQTKSKKKGEMRKLRDSFISEDAPKLKEYVILDVLIPAIKKAISDIVTNGVDMILYGETRHDRKTVNGSKVSYSSYYVGGNKEEKRDRSRVRDGFDYDDILFAHRGDAEVVLSAMEDTIDRYGFVSVLDMYDLADVSTSNYTLGNYGWKGLRGAKTVPASGGYVIKLPKPEPLK
mgnify:CR=1 FL=1